MEGDGTGVPPIPEEPRRKVLRAGVRIVADQFAPYSDEPPEFEEDGGFDFGRIVAGTINASQIQAGTFTWSHAKAFSKGSSLLQAMEDIQAAAAKVEASSYKPTSTHMQGIKKMFGVMDEVTPEPPPERDGEPKDYKPKGKKQTEPFYVKLGKKRRRR